MEPQENEKDPGEKLKSILESSGSENSSDDIAKVGEFDDEQNFMDNLGKGKEEHLTDKNNFRRET